MTICTKWRFLYCINCTKWRFLNKSAYTMKEVFHNLYTIFLIIVPQAPREQSSEICYLL